MLRQKSQFVVLIICTVVLANIAGCGGSVKGIDPDLVPVTGTVLLDGKPLASGIVGFAPEEEGASSSTGIIKNGKFTLKQTASAHGAKPGKYKISIQSWSTPPSMDKDGKSIKGVSAIHKKYNNPKTSGLSAEVKKDDTNDFTFELKKEG